MSSGGRGPPRVLAPLLVRAFPPAHGGARALLGTLVELARRGFRCVAVLRLQPRGAPDDRFEGQSLAGLVGAGIRWRSLSPGTLSFWWRGVRFLGVEGDPDDFVGAYRAEAGSAGPTLHLLGDQGVDGCPELLALAAGSGGLVYSAQTLNLQPFGPASIALDPVASSLLLRARLVLAPSRFLAAYIKEHLGIPASVYLPPVFRRPGHQASVGSLVGMINPCLWKGGPLFLEMARALPDVPFGAVPTWGPVVDELASLPNVTWIPESPDIGQVLRRFRVLVVPSLWQEAFGLVVVEAMLRGIPVVASDLGGLRESTLGACSLVAVTPLEFTRKVFGGVETVEPLVPPLALGPWLDALRPLVFHEGAWRAASERARAAAERFVARLRGGRIARLLRRAPG